MELKALLVCAVDLLLERIWGSRRIYLVSIHFSPLSFGSALASLGLSAKVARIGAVGLTGIVARRSVLGLIKDVARTTSRVLTRRTARTCGVGLS